MAKVLHVTVESAKGVSDGSWLSKSDPYVTVALGSTKKNTPPAKDGDKNPVWNHDLEFNVGSETSIDVRVFDSDVGFDDFLGAATISLSGVLASGSAKEVASLKTKDGKENGHITVSLKFGAPGAPGGKKTKKKKEDGGSSSSSDSD